MIKFYLVNNWKKIILLVIIASLLFVLYHINKNENTNQGGVICSDNSSMSSEKVNTYFFEVMGQVKNPGVYEMDKKILVIEAIELAGGFTEIADQAFVHKYLSLSSEIKSTQKIYIPALDEGYTLNNITTTDPSINSGLVKINLNTSDQKALMTITGVGEVTANKIIDLRPINNLEDLKKLSGVPQKTIQNILDKGVL